MARQRSWSDEVDFQETYPQRKVNRERRNVRHKVWKGDDQQSPQTKQRRGAGRAARTGTEEFRCRHCRAMVGPTVSGGRHRNHCPLCLYSRHVDRQRPGDRASDCGSIMVPIARFDRPTGEPVIIHRCSGCGVERHNRLAADDNLLTLARLPLVPPRLGWRNPVSGPQRSVARPGGRGSTRKIS